MLTTSHEEEPGFFEAVHPVIVRWKLLIAGITVGMSVAAILSLLLPKQYETSFLLKIGYINSPNPIPGTETVSVDLQLESARSVKEILNSVSFQQVAAANAGLKFSSDQLQGMIHAATNPALWEPAWVKVRVSADSPEKTLRLANSLIEGIVQRHGKLFADSIRPHEVFKKELVRKVELFRSETEILRTNLDRLSSGKQKDPSDEILLQSKLDEQENRILDLKKELHAVNISMSSVHSTNTSAAVLPVLPTSPSKPNLRLNVIVTFVCSFFLMTSFILLSERYKKGSLGI